MENDAMLEKLVKVDDNSEMLSNKERLKTALSEVQQLSQLQNDLSTLVTIQKEDLEKIENITHNISLATEKSNKELEAASGRSFKMLPIMLGTGMGVAVTLPVTIGLGLSAGIVGGAVAGGSILGGILGKNLAK